MRRTQPITVGKINNNNHWLGQGNRAVLQLCNGHMTAGVRIRVNMTRIRIIEKLPRDMKLPDISFNAI